MAFDKKNFHNDILVNSRKIAGILIENKIKGKILDSSRKIGLNIDNRSFNELNNLIHVLLNFKKLDKNVVLNSFIIH